MKTNKKGLISILILLLVMVMISIGYVFLGKRTKNTLITPELAKMRTYSRVSDGEETTNSEYVEFDSFFLADLDGDGYAEKVRGTCKEIGSQDTLYIELDVRTKGYLKDAKIKVNSDNFYFQTAIVRDNEISNNYININTKEIALNRINNGTQKLLSGFVKSGDYSGTTTKLDAIKNDISKYSKINSITLTGTHVIENEDGTTIETPVNKTVNFNVDWYGEVDCTIPSYIMGNIRNKNQVKEINECIDETNNTLNLTFNIATQENKNELMLKKSYIEGTIPEINGYAPTKVEITGANVKYTYDEQTRTFTAQREAILNDNEKITTTANSGMYYEERYNEYTLNIKYPLEAYTEAEAEMVELKIPMKAYYEGYNNTSEEFTNPYKSNIAEDIVVITWSEPKGEVANFSVIVGNYAYSPNRRYIVSKQKPLNIYNGISAEEKQDYYTVRWYGYTGTDGATNGMIMKETQDGGSQITDTFVKSDSSEETMINLTKNVGIYFSDPASLLGEDGWIKVYNDETNELIQNFTKENWNNYTSNKPYMYEKAIKHIRVETSSTNANSGIYVYNIKELDDEYITENYSKEEFDNLKYIKSTLAGYLKINNQKTLIRNDIHLANYEAPISVATLEIDPTAISTQETEESFKITINTKGDTSNNNAKWKNGAFLLKFPKEIIGLEINDIKIDNSDVKIASYEIYEEDGTQFIKILTENEIEGIYSIVVDCSITADPKTVTAGKQIQLYASNENCENYYYSAQDIHDIDGDLNTTEQVNCVTKTLSLVSPNSLLTSQEAKEYDDIGSVTVAPQIATVEKDQRTAKVNINIANNYSGTISEMQILGKIPFEGNTHILNGKETGSNFSTIMTNGIAIPDELKDIAKVYYTSNENPTRDLNDSENGWETNPTDFSNVKSFLIDLGSYVLRKDEKQDFTYEIQLPNEIAYNKIAYSVHAVYFTLDTNEGKYKTKVEPNKLGFMIAKKYNLELTKYQKNNEKTISGSTYSITEENTDESKTRVTNAEGKLLLTGLYAERTYIVKEIKSPEEYALNSDEVKFTTIIDENGNLNVQVISGNTKIARVTKQDNGSYKLELAVEDEVKANLEILKINKSTNEAIKGIKYQITGEGLGENGKVLTTNSEGKITLKGLYLNKEYTIAEVKATGYYLANPITFKVTEENGIFNVNILNGTVKQNSVIINNEIPTVVFNIDNEQIPTYDIEIAKVEKDKDKVLSGAQFKLEGEGITTPKYYTTDENGKLTITGLYQYVEGKNLEAEYILTETYAPEGYVVAKPITFKAQEIDGTLQLIIKDGTIKSQEIAGTKVKITIEDEPIFKLIKKDSTTEELLPNAKFEIYEVNETGEKIDYAKDADGNIIGKEETIDGKETYVVTTDENGEISCEIRAGLYKAIEVQAPENYDLPKDEKDRTYYFGVGKGQEEKYNNSVQWEKVEKTDDYKAVTTVKDGIIAVADGGQVIKYDLNGNVIWKNTEKSYNYRGIATVRDGVIAVGDRGQVVNDVGRIVKYDLEGNIVWENAEKSYSYNGVTPVEDGVIAIGYYMGASRVVKYDLYGNFIWEYSCQHSNGAITTVGNVIIAAGSGGIIEKSDLNGNPLGYNNKKKYSYFGIISVEDGVIAVAYGGQVVKYDLDMNVIWENTEKSYSYTKVTAVDDGIIAVSDGGQVVKYDLAGNVVWENIEKNYIYHYYGVATVKDGAIAVGSSGKVVKYNLNGKITLDHTEKYSYKGVTTIENGMIAVSDGGQIVKYDLEGNIVWKNTEKSYKYSIIATIEDGVIVVGNNGQVVKYDLNGNIIWEKVKEENYNYMDVTTVEGGIIVLSSTGEVVKYDLNGNVIWENVEKIYEYPNNYNKITTVRDGVIAVGIGGQVVKYDLEGNIIWENTEKNYYYSGVTTVEDGVVAVSNNGKAIKYGLEGNIIWENTEKNYSYSGVTTVEDGVVAVSSNGQVVKYGSSLISSEIPEMQELIVKNNLKEFEITTAVNEYEETVNGVTSKVRGGSISGEGNLPYEKVTYGKDSSKEIKAVPDAGYKVISITVNGEEIPYNVEADGSVILNKFTNMQEDKKVVVTFSNTKSNVIVHHMLATKNEDGSYTYTQTKLAEDENINGIIGQNYTTSPKVDLEKYELIKDINGDYILPANATGIYEKDTKEVNYYYSKKEIPITVHYYINGTEEKVPSKDGGVVEDITASGTEGSKYATAPSANVSDKYELVTMPTNKEGILEAPEVIVTYYYKEKTYNITTEVKSHEETDKYGNVSKVDGGTITGKDIKPYETLKHGENSTKEIKVTADEGYRIKSIVVQNIDEEANITEESIQIDEKLSEYTLSLFENVTSNKNVIVEFERTKGAVTVHYYIEGTTNKVPTQTGLAEDIIKTGNVGEMYATKEAEGILSKYELVSEPENASGEYTEENIVVNYYYRLKDTGVTVKYINKLTNEEIADEVLIEGKVDDEYQTEQKQIEGYTFVESTENTTGVMIEELIEVKYYYIKNANVVVKYVDKKSGEEISEAVNKKGKIGDSFDIEENKKEIEGYTLIEEPETKTGTMTEQEQVFTYYYAKNTKVIVKHLEKDTNEILVEEETILGYEGKEYNTEKKDIENYTFIESTENVTGTMTEEPITVIYYYAQNTSARVQYIDKITEDILDEEIAIGVVGDLFVTEAKDFENYVLVEQPEQKTVAMEKNELVLKYYYIHVSAGVIEKHIDDVTGDILYNTTYEGNEGDSYSTNEKIFEGYELIKEKYPENSEGTMTIEPIEVKYYYKKTAKVTTKYVDIITEEEITEKETQTGYEEDEYKTEEKEIDNYVIVKERYPENAEGKMKVTVNEDGTFENETIVTYYYVHKSAGVVEKHIDEISGKTLEEITHEGNEGDSYETKEKEFEGYELVKEKYPNNSTGNMTKDLIEVDYYYIRKAAVKVEYIDKTTEEILDTEEIGGHENDEYTAENKKYDGYDLIEVPENSKGIMNADNPITVKYYYIRKAKVIVKYLENETDKVLEKEQKIEGYQNDSYSTEEKDIKYYKLVKEKYPSNAEGKMEVKKNEDGTVNNITEIVYYYEKLPFNMKVEKWIEKVTVNGKEQKGNKLDNSKLVKVEIYRKDVKDAEVKIAYKIRITNTEELEGYVGKVIDKIPNGLIFNIDDNEKYWTQEGNTIKADLSKEKIEPRKYKELEVVLTWDKNADNLKVKTNTAEIRNVVNSAKFEETTTEDNKSQTSILITVSTGENKEIITITIQALATALILVGTSIVINKKK